MPPKQEELGAVAERGQRKPRRAPPDERPQTLIDLLWALTGSRERAQLFIEIIACTVIILCIPACIAVDAVTLASKGAKGLTLGTLLPSGFVGGGGLAYLIIRIKRILTNQRQGEAKPHDEEKNASH